MLFRSWFVYLISEAYVYAHHALSNRSKRVSSPSVLWLAVPLLTFGLIPWILGPFVSTMSLPSAQVFTSMAPFGFSVSVSFGSAAPLVLENRPLQDQSPFSETSIPITFVMGAILAIFTVHVVINLVHGFRTNRFRVVVRRGIRRGPGADAAGQPENRDGAQEATG